MVRFEEMGLTDIKSVPGWDNGSYIRGHISAFRLSGCHNCSHSFSWIAMLYFCLCLSLLSQRITGPSTVRPLNQNIRRGWAVFIPKPSTKSNYYKESDFWLTFFLLSKDVKPSLSVKENVLHVLQKTRRGIWPTLRYLEGDRSAQALPTWFINPK